REDAGDSPGHEQLPLHLVVVLDGWPALRGLQLGEASVLDGLDLADNPVTNQVWGGGVALVAHVQVIIGHHALLQRLHVGGDQRLPLTTVAHSGQTTNIRRSAGSGLDLPQLIPVVLPTAHQLRNLRGGHVAAARVQPLLPRLSLNRRYRHAVRTLPSAENGLEKAKWAGSRLKPSRARP